MQSRKGGELDDAQLDCLLGCFRTADAQSGPLVDRAGLSIKVLFVVSVGAVATAWRGLDYAGVLIR